MFNVRQVAGRLSELPAINNLLHPLLWNWSSHLLCFCCFLSFLIGHRNLAQTVWDDRIVVFFIFPLFRDRILQTIPN